MLDTAAGSGSQTLLPADVSYASIEIMGSFIKPLRADAGEMEFRGRALRVGRRGGSAVAHGFDGDGELIGHAIASLALVRP
jgi:acyl-coenzyme A thioesterase PaaI-like protein